jgi:MFS family permease
VTSQVFIDGGGPASDSADSRASWMRLGISVVITTISSVGMWSIMVALPAIQAEFAVSRADATLPFTTGMFGFAIGGVLFGRIADRRGIAMPLVIGAFCLAVGYVGASYAPTLWQFSGWHFLLGLGAAAAFSPLMADISYWFVARRGIAVGICASGNYFAGAIWPPVIQHFIASSGWRVTYMGIGLFCLATLPLLSLLMRRRAPMTDAAQASSKILDPRALLGLSPNALQALLAVAGIACCVAMAMPQVHLVAYCGDLGYGPARGAEMLALMLALGIVSRIGSGYIADRIGGVGTLLLGSLLQGLALTLYLFFDGLASLFLISALFGLFQGGIVPSYAIIIREYYPSREAGSRLGVVIMATVFGMILGGWLSGYIFDVTGSYQAAFLNGIGWNLLNLCISLWLLSRPHWRGPAALPARS